jgi:superfamily II DNA or RNA helicase
MSAAWFVQSMFKLTAYLRLGCSATPRRTDGKDFVFKSHLGDVMSKASNHLLPPKVIVIKSGWKMPVWKKRDPFTGGYTTVPIPHQAGRMASVVKAMGSDDQRNHLIADLCVKAYNKGRKTVIFFEQIDSHLKKLRPILVKMGIPPKDISEYIGGLTEQQRIDNAKARVILGSYAYFSEGTDIPDLDTAILASPRSNIMQAIGRILRVLEGKKEPVIFDIVDECSPVLIGMHHSRMRHYNELKANIVKMS